MLVVNLLKTMALELHKVLNSNAALHSRFGEYCSRAPVRPRTSVPVKYNEGENVGNTLIY